MRNALLLLLLLPVVALGQLVSGRVVDADTGQPLPYCTVAITGASTGTITNAEGAFALHAQPSDVLLFSYVGYAKQSLTVSSLGPDAVVRMHPSVAQLREFEVRSEDNYPYQLVARCTERMRRAETGSARLYFEMSTHMDDQPVEVLECFYNAMANGPHIASLDLKQGRIGMARFKNRYFVSLDMTRAMSLLDIRDDHVKFPVGPFHFNKARALRKRYEVTWLGSEKGTSTEHLSIAPRDSSGKYFSADVWVDSRTAEPRSIELKCTNCKTYPFIPLKPQDRIEDLDMTVRFTFTDDKLSSRLHHMELSYALKYTDDAGERRVRTTAVMHLFDLDASFILPLFDYDRDQNDYRKITFQPYDSVFWATSPALVRTEAQDRDARFFAEHGVVTGSTRVAVQRGTLFESNYAWWSEKKRVSLRTLPGAVPPPAATSPRNRTTTIPASSVELVAQIYLDLDTTGGQLRHYSATVFDGFRSYYHLPEQPYTDAFLNIYFDLCEIERRHMEEEIALAGADLERIRDIHAKATAAIASTGKEYMHETRLGDDRRALQRWNDRVKEALGIDNITLFGL